MSFKLKFDEMKENDPSKNEVGKDENLELYPNSGNSRNLLFTWPSGDSEFLNYSYLVGGKFFKEESKIVLTYTSHLVTLKGLNLKDLHDALLLNFPKRIDCVEERYVETLESNDPVVTEIVIVPNS
ncbi:MAG TPA: hypothetical protein PLN13_03485 [Bacteroidia bacterium]|nr:hypothetical protein [Bacteroidia bacterium]HRH07617.1 hypothetical protein [Bacteroidia bacterium]